MTLRSTLMGMLLMAAVYRGGSPAWSDPPSAAAPATPVAVPAASPAASATPTPEDKVSDSVSQQVPSPAPTWDPRLQMHGSVTFRAEEDTDGSHNLIQPRLRYKAYDLFTLDASDQVQYGVRLRTGNPFTPNSASETIQTHQTIGFQMDEAFVDYHPRRSPGWDFELGDFAEPYRYSPVYNQMEWSPDNENFGGVAARYQDPDGRYWMMAGYGFDMPQDTGGFGGVTDVQAQAGYVFKSDSLHRLEASLGMQWFGFTPGGIEALLLRNKGNAVQTITITTVTTTGSGKKAKTKTTTTTENVGLASGYDLLDPRLDYYFVAGHRNTPMVATLEYFDNLASSLPSVNVNGKTGFGIGIMAGQVKWPGTIAVRLEYMELGQDSVLSMFNQSDFPKVVNYNGFYFSISQPISRRLTINWILDQVDQSSTTNLIDRARVDFVYTY